MRGRSVHAVHEDLGTPIEMEYNMSESLIYTIRLFSKEGSDNCATVKLGGKQSCAVLAGHNENEPHLMSLYTCRTREPSPSRSGEGRREPSKSSNAVKVRCKQSKKVQRSGGVCGDGMPRSISRRSRETLHSGEASTTSTSYSNSKACWVMQGVRVLHSSDEAAVIVVERREGTYVDAIHRKKGGGDGR